jgi:hypothetical protein
MRTGPGVNRFSREVRILYTRLQEGAMSTHSSGGGDGAVVTLTLNQQQLELIDRTVGRGIARDREELIKLALREYAAARADGTKR